MKGTKGKKRQKCVDLFIHGAMKKGLAVAIQQIKQQQTDGDGKDGIQPFAQETVFANGNQVKQGQQGRTQG